MDFNKKIFLSHRDICIPSTRIYSKRVSRSYILPKISRFINKYLYRLGVGSTINRYDNSFSLYSANADKKLYSDFSKSDIFINFGSGAFFHNKWKNYDFPGKSKLYQAIQGKEGRDFHAIDLCEPSLKIPEKDNSVSMVYCSHTLEHIEQEAAKRFLKECHRIMKPNGVMRIALPNTKNNFYLYECLAKQFEDGDVIEENYLRSCATEILADTENLLTNEIRDLFKAADKNSRSFYNSIKNKKKTFTRFDNFDPGRHITYWDFETLIDLIKELSFHYCIPFYQGSSVLAPYSNLSVFDNTESHISFYADIIK